MWERIILVMVLMCSVAYAQIDTSIPKDTNTVIISKIQQEHQTTKQYISTELKKINDANMGEFTKRADYYEAQFRKIQNYTLLKLGLLVGGIYMFLSSLSYYLRNRTEKRKYSVLKKSLLEDLKVELKPDMMTFPKEVLDGKIQTYTDAKKGIDKIFNRSIGQKVTGQMPTQEPQPQTLAMMGFFERRKYMKKQRQIARLKKNLAKLQGVN